MALTRGNHSFFGGQEGDFSIQIHAIAAKREIAEDDVRGEAAEQGEEEEEEDNPKAAAAAAAEAAALKKLQTRRRSWLRRLLCGLI